MKKFIKNLFKRKKILELNSDSIIHFEHDGHLIFIGRIVHWAAEATFDHKKGKALKKLCISFEENEGDIMRTKIK